MVNIHSRVSTYTKINAPEQG